MKRQRPLMRGLLGLLLAASAAIAAPATAGEYSYTFGPSAGDLTGVKNSVYCYADGAILSPKLVGTVPAAVTEVKVLFSFDARSILTCYAQACDATGCSNTAQSITYRVLLAPPVAKDLQQVR